jgi:cell wall-associated NlpC family hydrolase
MAPLKRFAGNFAKILAATLAAVSLHACGTVPVEGPQYTGGPDRYEATPARHEVVRIAEQLIGTPYRYGGNNPYGFDCSGLVQYTHRQVGIDVPRTTGSQWAQARIPERQHLLPGDLLFFNIDAQKSRHVGIYEGDGVFIHAPSSGKHVSRGSLDNPFWSDRLVATRTFL